MGPAAVRDAAMGGVLEGSDTTLTHLCQHNEAHLRLLTKPVAPKLSRANFKL